PREPCFLSAMVTPQPPESRFDQPELRAKRKSGRVTLCELGSANGLFGSQINGHQELHGHALLFARELIDAGDLSEKFLIERPGTGVVGEGHKDAHVEREDGVLWNEVHAVARRINGRQDFVKIMLRGLRRPHSDHARESVASFAPAFLIRGTHHKVWGNFGNALSTISQMTIGGRRSDVKLAKCG